MSTSASACFEFAAQTPRNFSRKTVPYHLLGSVAIACLIAGCGWTIYNNVFGASIYPSVGSGNADVAVIRQASAIRKPVQIADSSVIVETPPAVAAPAKVAQGPSFSFDERFAAAAPQSVAPAPRFEDRFAAAAPQSVAPSQQAARPPQQVAALAPAPAAERKVAEAAPPSHSAETKAAKHSGASIHDMAQRAKSAVISVASAERPGWKPEKPEKAPSIFERLFGRSDSSESHNSTPSALAYASADLGSTSSLGSASQNIASAGTGALYDRQTAVYDISAHTVYLPDGTKLEAHSGLGSSLDDPRSASIRMRGVTPPHLYDLTPRESLFHGVAALRLNPVGGESTIYGRAGLLAHTFMLGPNGDSNGCVSFRDYNAFLSAYRNKGVRRLAVVAHL